MHACLVRVVPRLFMAILLTLTLLPGPVGAASPPLTTLLTGADEAPSPGDPDGTGSVTLTLDQEQAEVCFELTVAGIAPATAAHIHKGPAGVAGPIVVGLTPPTSGSASGCVGLDPAQIADILRHPGDYYVNVHNLPFPNGALRGQLGGSTTWYFAEGYTGDGFDEYLTIQNPSSVPAAVAITYYLANGTTAVKSLTAPANARTTVAVHDPIDGVGPGQAVSAKVQSTNGVAIVVERPMYFVYKGAITGGHNVLGATSPQPAWYFAEGYTGEGFEEYLTIMNPNPEPAAVTITYFLADGGYPGYGSTQIVYVIVPATARYTVAVHETAEGVGPGQAVSAKVETDHPGGIVVERPIYFTYNGSSPGITGGHNVMGANAPRQTWLFAEGYTGEGFDEYLTILNPNDTAVPIAITYYLADGGTIEKSLTVSAYARGTVTVHDDAQGVGRGQAVAARVSTTDPDGIVVERPIYFTYNGSLTGITGGHNVLGAAEARATWYFAEGYTGEGFEEYLTILNPNATPAPVTITYYLASGGTVVKSLTVAATTRATVAVHDATSGVGRGQAVSARVTTTHPDGIVAERPMYFRYQGSIDGGHNVMGFAP